MSRILKWQGGKSSLMEEIKPYLPMGLFDSDNRITFIDAFAGGGSVFEYVLNNCPGVDRIVVNDINYNLIQLYSIIQSSRYELLIDELRYLQADYDTAPDKLSFYLNIRDKYNHLAASDIHKAAWFVVLNKLCFNGIYRENSIGQFNVPANDKVKNSVSIKIFDEQAIIDLHDLMWNSSKVVEFYHGDFSHLEKCIIPYNTFIYLDPPYRPLSGSPSFTAYSKTPFNDATQKRLKLFCDKVWMEYAVNIMQSNSFDPNDDFLQKLYKNYGIYQISARRSSGGKNAMRGNILENLIVNY